jgi:hypothetical protein
MEEGNWIAMTGTPLITAEGTGAEGRTAAECLMRFFANISQ